MSTLASVKFQDAVTVQGKSMARYSKTQTQMLKVRGRDAHNQPPGGSGEVKPARAERGRKGLRRGRRRNQGEGACKFLVLFSELFLKFEIISQ